MFRQVETYWAYFCLLDGLPNEAPLRWMVKLCKLKQVQSEVVHNEVDDQIQGVQCVQ